jgi:hypothetical protein
MAYLGKSIERQMYFGAKPELFRLALRMRRYPTVSEESPALPGAGERGGEAVDIENYNLKY